MAADTAPDLRAARARARPRSLAGIAVERDALRFTKDELVLALGGDLYDDELRDRMEAMLIELAFELLAAGRSCILDFGLWSREERDALRLRARAQGVRVELHVLDVEPDELLRRIDDALRRRAAHDRRDQRRAAGGLGVVLRAAGRGGTPSVRLSAGLALPPSAPSRPRGRARRARRGAARRQLHDAVERRLELVRALERGTLADAQLAVDVDCRRSRRRRERRASG